MVDKTRFRSRGDLHFQNDFLNGWEEDGEPVKKIRYEPHVLEIPTPQRKISSEKTIFLDPTKYKFNEQPKPKYSIIERFLYWLIR